MNCASAIDGLLEAEPQELRGEGDSELALHLATCEGCSRVAAALVAGQLELAQSLESESPSLAVTEAMRLAETKASAIRRRNAFWQIGAPLAAAAGIAGFIGLSGGNEGFDRLEHARVPEALPGLEIQSPPGMDVAVFEVADRPDVVVVWFFDAGDD